MCYTVVQTLARTTTFVISSVPTTSSRRQRPTLCATIIAKWRRAMPGITRRRTCRSSVFAACMWMDRALRPNVLRVIWSGIQIFAFTVHISIACSVGHSSRSGYASSGGVYTHCRHNSCHNVSACTLGHTRQDSVHILDPFCYSSWTTWTP